MTEEEQANTISSLLSEEALTKSLINIKAKSRGAREIKSKTMLTSEVIARNHSLSHWFVIIFCLAFVDLAEG
jgi:hypothetical protein